MTLYPMRGKASDFRPRSRARTPVVSIYAPRSAITAHTHGMERLQAFKYELMPTDRQRHEMPCFAGACRYVFNKALDVEIARHEAGEKRLGYFGLSKLLTGWRHSDATPWLKDAPSQPLQQALKDLERAYVNFFAQRAGFPRFKKKGRHDSFRYPQPEQIKLDQANGRLFLPKLGWLRYRNSRAVLGEVRNATVSRHAGRWFVAIQTMREVAPAIAQGDMVGVDMGIVRFATFSDGSNCAPLNSFTRHESALRKAQQALSRKVKHSHNWRKALARVQRIHAHIGNARRDCLHKASSTLCNNHAVVCIEDLQVRGMSGSAAGTPAAPGRRVRAKSGLNKSILDQGWYEFRRQLAYKLDWHGGKLVVVPPHHTSQTCPACGHVSADNRRTRAMFACVSCGYANNADVVGAINVLRRGVAILCSEGRDCARIACVVNGDAMPSTAGTHLGDVSRPMAGQRAAGIPSLSA